MAVRFHHFLRKAFNINDAFLSGVERRSFSCFIGIDEGDYGELDWDIYLPGRKKNLQRGLVWSNEQKNDFLINYFSGSRIMEFCPPIILHSISSVVQFNVVESKTLVIDGKQRLSTLLAFYRDEFPITISGKEFYYSHQIIVSQDPALMPIIIRNEETSLSIKDWIAENENALCNQFRHINSSAVAHDKEHLDSLK